MGVAFLLCYFGLSRQGEFLGAKVYRSFTLSLSKAKRLWSNSPEEEAVEIDQRFFSRDSGIRVKV